MTNQAYQIDGDGFAVFDFNTITVYVKAATGDVRVRGPQAFTDAIVWDDVSRTAALFAAHSPTPAHAVAVAIQMKFAAWEGTQDILRRLSGSKVA